MCMAIMVGKPDVPFISRLRIQYLHHNFFSFNVVYTTVASFKGNVTAIDRALKTRTKLYMPGYGKAGDQRIAEDYRKFMSILRETVARYYGEGMSDFEMKPNAVDALSEFKDG